MKSLREWGLNFKRMDLCAFSVCSFSFPPLTRKELAIQAHHRKYSIEEEIDDDRKYAHDKDYQIQDFTITFSFKR